MLPDTVGFAKVKYSANDEGFLKIKNQKR